MADAPPDASNASPERDAIGFVLALARALHRYGTPAHRLEDAMGRCCDRLGLAAEVFSTPTTIMMSFGPAVDLRTRMLRVDGGELDLGKLAQVDALADAVSAHAITPADGLRELDAIVAAPPQFSRALSTLGHALTCGALAVFFGGGAQDVALAAAIGLSLGMLAQVLARSTEQARVFELVGAALAAMAANIASAYAPSISAPLVTVAALIVLLPGLSLTVAMTELATRNPIAGTARLMSAVIVLLELVIGVALGERLAAVFVVPGHAIAAPLPAWSQWIALLAATVGATMLVQAQLRAFGWILAACVAGYVGTRYGTAWLGGQLGAVVGALALGVLANAYARWLDRPAQIVLVPAMLLLVPGSMGFRGMESLLDQQTVSGVETVFAMFIVATAIVAGLLISTAIVSPRRSL